MSEEILPGGTLTGGVVRVGDTVRRPAGPWTPAVQALLRHLHDAGFPGGPRPLGLDERGREVLTFVPGTRHWAEGHGDVWGGNADFIETHLARRRDALLD
jgi:hypothetical protein